MWVAVILLLLGVVAANPQVNFPLSEQFFPVARVGQAYSFQFASTTFQPDPNGLQYSLIGNPSWLSLMNRTLHGTPGPGDVGSSSFTITAAGQAGAVANLDSTLLVTDAPTPTTNGNITDMLSHAGPLSGPKLLILPPSKSFEINFPSDLFSGTGKSTTYYATLADHTPLPAWVAFDASSLRFSGTTPPANTSPQSYDLVLIASDTPGYTDASVSFTLAVSDHQLVFKPLEETIDVEKGQQLTITGLQSKLFLDNTSTRDQDFQSASAELPSWLSFNNQTLEISGMPPSSAASQDIKVTVQDKFGDTATHSIHLNVISPLFSGEIGTLNLTAGDHFAYQIPKSILRDENATARLDLRALGEWLKFDPSSFTISGTVPQDFASQSVNVTMSATSSDGKTKDSQAFSIEVLDTGSNTPTTSENPISSGQPNDRNQTSDAADQTMQAHKRVNVIAGAVVASIIGASIVALFVFFWCRSCRRKRNTKGYLSPKTPRSPRKSDISRPIRHVSDTMDKSFERDIEKGDMEGEDSPLERTPEHPPQLKPTHIRKHGHSPATSLSERESQSFSQFNESSYGIAEGEAGPSHRPHDSMKIPTDMARRTSEISTFARRSRRRTSPVFRDAKRSSGLPLERVLSGAGHGRHRDSPSRSSFRRSGRRRTPSSSSFGTKRTSALSTVPSAPARPVLARHTTQLTTLEPSQSVRLVPTTEASSVSETLSDRKVTTGKRASTSRQSSLDTRPIDEKRRSYIKKRASAQSPSPFFSYNPLRMSSSSHKYPPAFLNDNEEHTEAPSSPLVTTEVITANQDVREPTRDYPESLRIRKPSETPSVDPPRPIFPGSWRKPPAPRSWTRRAITSTAVEAGDDQTVKTSKPSLDAKIAGLDVKRRPSTRQTSRIERVKSSLNEGLGSEVYEDPSESDYSGQDDDIEECEKRTTLKPNHYAPLNLTHLRRNRSDKKRDSKRDSKRQSKRLSQRDPTPYSLAGEHGGKENQSSTYSLAPLPDIKGKTKATSTRQSPERPRTFAASSTISNTQRQKRPARHSRAESRTTNRSSTQRDSDPKFLSRQLSNRSRHSRTQSKSGSQPRHTHTRTLSRPQSSAYPHIPIPSRFDTDITKISSTLIDPSKLPSTTLPPRDVPDDASGNIEDPTISALDPHSHGLRASHSQIASEARRSRPAQPTRASARQDSKRNTTIGPAPSTRLTTSEPSRPRKKYSLGHGLSIFDSPVDSSPLGGGRSRERTPLSLLAGENGATPTLMSTPASSPALPEREGERLRVFEGKGKRPVSQEVGEELRAGASRKGRTTWGSSLRRVVTGGRSYWEGKGKEGEKEEEGKMFL
ncbi:hypothetical protein K491DRAFT_518142 [Lophiostoma macrostomum CBS 122681]|uniref:Dystroglycan-type cadherin-like domain-containing protein n=1 Tax=Lophiostoma macrostomum CBS 122681 TaxID=1314788 RepID=A0A6A6T393_9PLEO|nr:hypothetical protein K491DRAFT_518142 [Lophiostoma macrostomum CBS 122681]